MNKRILALACSLLITSLLGAAERLSVMKTEYFDIIYPQASRDTALLIYSRADDFAREISALLETTISKRMPVYINPSVQSLNAYFSPAPYSRIVLYDTIAQDGELAVFSDTILMVFYHELVHAVSLNIRTPFWQLMSRIFGDFVSVNSGITMPYSFIEGVTVSLESRAGEGRLNDPLVRHQPAQDGREGAFLSWKEASGARDTYPALNTAYVYGGFFSAWLQKTYGMEKYAELWRRGGGFNPFLSFTQTRFRQTYGIPLDKAWMAFEADFAGGRAGDDTGERVETLPQPAYPDAPEGLFGYLASSPALMVWANTDEGAVFARYPDGRVTRLFDADSSVSRLSISPDGTWLSVSRTAYSHSGAEPVTELFDLVSLSFRGERFAGLRDAAFFGNGGMLAGIENEGQRISLVLVDIRSGNKTTVAQAGPGNDPSAFYNPTDGGEGLLFYIAAMGSARKLVSVDTVTGTSTVVPLPPRVDYLRYLQSYRSGTGTYLSFAWAEPEGLYRYALYDPLSKTLELQEGDFSGGVFYPAISPDGERILFVSRFSGKHVLSAQDRGVASSRLLMLGIEERSGSEDITGEGKDATVRAYSRPFPSRLPVEIPYSPLPWLFDGIFIPVPVKMPAGVANASGNIAPGFYYASGDPSERFSFVINPAFSPDPFFVPYTVQTGIGFRPVSISLTLSDSLAQSGTYGLPYRTLSFSVGAHRNLFLGSYWKNLSITWEQISRNYASDVTLNTETGIYAVPFTAHSLASSLFLDWSAVKSSALIDFPVFAVKRKGVTASVNAYGGLLLPDRAFTPLLQVKGEVFFPLIPLSFEASAAFSDGLLFSPLYTRAETKCARDFDAGLNRFVPSFPEYAKSGYDIAGSGYAAGIRAELALFTLEIQSGVPVLPVYANRFIVSGGYRGGWFGDEGRVLSYIDTGYAKASMQGTLVIGALSSVLLILDAEYAYPLRGGAAAFSWKVRTSLDL